ncbi:MAG: tRNA pseudouridine(13) synthase TruD [Candidatus Thermoplasmatota archaeon]|nr:tRNA pseudouridine(13) synthase TruD [Candidatus Thermoplasmatota archaeon]
MSEARIRKPPDEEINIGLGRYLTSTEPLGGRLRKKPEDFQVSEIAKPPPLNDNGHYTIAQIKVYNWETNKLIRAFSKRLGISRRKIGFAGTKDKRAVTTQYFSFYCSEELVKNLSLKDVYVLDAFRSSKPLFIGDLQGNDFLIRIRGIDKNEREIKDITSSSIDEISSHGGFPNYFGIQRFGSVRPITHLVGKHILNLDHRSAVLSYLCNPFDKENEKGYEARRVLQNTMDFKKALDNFPNEYIFERAMINELCKKPDDWIAAIEILPENLKMMFIHAYQSYIFNMIITERMNRGIPLSSPEIGDVIIPLNKNLLPDHRTHVHVTRSNISEMERLVKARKAYVSGLIIGYEAVMADGEMGDIERKILEKEHIEPDSFFIKDIKGISSRGIRRELISIPFDLKWRVIGIPVNNSGSMESFENALEVKFSLFKGTYATSFLREIMKAGILDY